MQPKAFDDQVVEVSILGAILRKQSVGSAQHVDFIGEIDSVGGVRLASVMDFNRAVFSTAACACRRRRCKD